MTDHKGQAVSPYLMKPLRSLQQALAERQRFAALHGGEPSERLERRVSHKIHGTAKATTQPLSRVA